MKNSNNNDDDSDSKNNTDSSLIIKNIDKGIGKERNCVGEVLRFHLLFALLIILASI